MARIRPFGEESWIGDHRPVCLELETVGRPPEGWVWQALRRFEVEEADVQAHKHDYLPALEKGSLEQVYAQWCDSLLQWLGELVGDAFPRLSLIHI